MQTRKNNKADEIVQTKEAGANMRTSFAAPAIFVPSSERFKQLVNSLTQSDTMLRLIVEEMCQLSSLGYTVGHSYIAMCNSYQTKQNASQFPDKKTFENLWKRGLKENLKKDDINEVTLLNLETLAKGYEGIIRIVKTNGYIAVVICTPFMQRALVQLSVSDDLVLLHSEPVIPGLNVNFKVYFLVSECHGFGLPLACIISNSGGTGSVLKEAVLELCRASNCALKIINPGPATVILDNITRDRYAVYDLWTNTSVLISKTQLLRDAWSWLQQQGSNLDQSGRIAEYRLFKKLVESKSEKETFDNYRDFVQKNQYEPFLKFVGSLYKERLIWDSNSKEEKRNFVFFFRLLKDLILHNARLLDYFRFVQYVIREFDTVFRERVVDLVETGQFDLFWAKTIGIFDCNNTEFQVEEKELDMQFIAKHQHWVDLRSGLCSCPVGSIGNLCAHQLAAIKKFLKCDADKLSEEAKDVLYTIATNNPRKTTELSSYTIKCEEMDPEEEETVITIEESEEQKPDISTIDTEVPYTSDVQELVPYPSKIQQLVPYSEPQLVPYSMVTVPIRDPSELLSLFVDKVKEEITKDPVIGIAVNRFYENFVNGVATPNDLYNGLCSAFLPSNSIL